MDEHGDLSLCSHICLEIAACAPVNIIRCRYHFSIYPGFSAAPTKFAYGIYLENGTWFEANATCYAAGYEHLLHSHDPKRMYWAAKRHMIRTR